MTTPTALSAPPGALYEQAAQFQDDLGARQQAAVDQVLAAHAEVYARVRVEYEAVITKIAAAQQAGQPFSPAWLYQRTRLKNALALTKTEIAGLAEYAGEQVRQAQWSAIQASLNYAAKAGQTALAETGVSATFTRTDPEVMRHLIGFLADGTPVSNLLDSLGVESADQIRRALVQGVALGKGQDWMRAKVDQGLNLPRWRIETILRTEAMRAARSATRAGYLANADVLAGWVWTAALDGRVCPCCLVMDGTVHPLHATLDGHPRCRCAMVPRTKTYAELLGVDEDEVGDSRPPLRSGKAWLEAQSPATQRALLGPGKFQAWKAGKVSLDDLVARTYSPAWGTMRRERSLREIRAGVNADYPDVEAAPVQVTYEPDAAVVQMMTANFSVAEVEDLLKTSTDGQHRTNLKAALATLLNGQAYEVALPQPDEDVVAAWTAKMNAAPDAKGYPSKGYSQTVAIYKARANGTPGTKVGIIQSLTWQDKINAQEALRRHQDFLDGWLAEQEAKAEAEALKAADLKAAVDTAKNLWEQFQSNLNSAQTHQGALDAHLGAESASMILWVEEARARYLQRVQASLDAYAQARLEVLDLKTLQGPTWSAPNGAGLVLDDDGWGTVTYPTGNSLTLPPGTVMEFMASGNWKVGYEPQPAQVASMVAAVTTDDGFLDVEFVKIMKDKIAEKGETQWTVNAAAALQQAEATLPYAPEADVVTEQVQIITGGGLPLVDTMIGTYQDAIDQDTFQDTEGKSAAQHKANGVATLAALKDWKAQQATVQAKATPFDLDGAYVTRARVILSKVLHDSGGLDAYLGDPDPALVHAAKVGMHLAAIGTPRWDVTKWPGAKRWLADDEHGGQLTDAERLKISGFLKDLQSGKTKPETLAKGIGPNNVLGNRAKWAALFRYYAEKPDLDVPAAYKGSDPLAYLHPKPGDTVQDPDGSGLLTWDPSWPQPEPGDEYGQVGWIVQQTKDDPNAWTPKSIAQALSLNWVKEQKKANYWSALKALETPQAPNTPPTGTQPLSVAPSPALGPFGAPPDPANLTWTGQTLGTHGAKVYTDTQGGRWLYKPPKDPRDQFLVDADVAASVLQAQTGLKAPDTFAVEIDGQRGSIQRMFDAQPAFPGGFRPADLSQADLLTVQQQHVLDWLLGNHDGHLEQFLRQPDGTLVGIDKGQAFRWYGMDRLDWNFHPNGYYGAPPPVYNALYAQFAQGGTVEVLDPRSGPLADYIAALEDLDDDALRALFRPYAEKAAARGLLAKRGQPQPGLTSPDVPENDVAAFLDLLVARKNGLGEAFSDLWDRAAKERAKNKPGWKPTRAEPTAAQKAKAALKALKGAPEPVKPEPPDLPGTSLPSPDYWEAWLAGAEARYQANPNKAKANLQATANWSRFTRVMENLDRSAVEELHTRQYLDDAQRQTALDLIDAAEKHREAARAAYDVLQAQYERELALWQDRIEKWRKANGIVIKFAGMDGAVRHTDNSQGMTWAKARWDTAKWDSEQRNALRTYTTGQYTAWNGQLRRTDGVPGPYKASMDKVDAAMKAQPIPEDVVVHRGTGLSAFVDSLGQRLSDYGDAHRLGDLTGTVQKDHGYISTSVGIDSAFSGQAFIKFRVPKGYPAAFVDNGITAHPGEREIILARGTSFYIHAVYKNGGRWIVEAEVVPEGWTPPLDSTGKPITQPSTEKWSR